MKAEDKLKGLIAELISENQKVAATEDATEKAEAYAKLIESNDELKAKIAKLEAAPAKKVELAVPGTTETKTYLYKGYNMKNQGLIIPEERREKIATFLIDAITGKAMNEGTGSAGGYMVPVEYESELLAHARLNSVILKDARMMTMGSDTLKVPKEATNVSVAWTAEAVTLTESNPVVGEVELVAQKLGAFSTSSNELLADSTTDIVSLLTSQFGEAIGQELDNQAFNGTTFTGMLSGGISTNIVTCASTTTVPNRSIQITETELSEAIANLSSNKLNGAKFYMHRNALHYIRILEDGAGNKVWALPGQNVPGTIYEYPYEIVEQIPGAPNAGDSFIVFGNLKNYILGVRKGSWTLEVDPYGLFTKDQTRFRVVTRWDGEMGLENGLVAIETSGP